MPTTTGTPGFSDLPTALNNIDSNLKNINFLNAMYLLVQPPETPRRTKKLDKGW